MKKKEDEGKRMKIEEVQEELNLLSEDFEKDIAVEDSKVENLVSTNNNQENENSENESENSEKSGPDNIE